MLLGGGGYFCIAITIEASHHCQESHMQAMQGSWDHDIHGVLQGSIYEQAAEDIFYGAHGKCVTATSAAARKLIGVYWYSHWLMGTKAAARQLGCRLNIGQLLTN